MNLSKALHHFDELHYLSGEKSEIHSSGVMLLGCPVNVIVIHCVPYTMWSNHRTVPPKIKWRHQDHLGLLNNYIFFLSWKATRTDPLWLWDFTRVVAVSLGPTHGSSALQVHYRTYSESVCFEAWGMLFPVPWTCCGVGSFRWQPSANDEQSLKGKYCIILACHMGQGVSASVWFLEGPSRRRPCLMPTAGTYL